MGIAEFDLLHNLHTSNNLAEHRIAKRLTSLWLVSALGSQFLILGFSLTGTTARGMVQEAIVLGVDEELTSR